MCKYETRAVVTSMLWALLPGLVGIGSSGCQVPGPSKPLAMGKSVVKKTDVRVNGLRRSYRLYVPENDVIGHPAPLVVVIHGAFSTAKEMERVTGFSQLADEGGFLVAYPNGMGLLGFLQHWNAGHCCGKAKKDGVDDVGFLETVIEDIQRHVAVDSARIYMVGFSNGGMLAHRFAAERSERVAAVAALAASIGGRDKDDEQMWQIPAPASPVPMLIMHGDTDDSVPYSGGESMRHKGQYYVSVERSMDFWMTHNRCHPTPSSRTLKQGHVRVTQGQHCDDPNAVILYTLKGWTHQWPGLYFTRKLPTSHPLHGFDGTRIIWEFLKSHSQRAPDLAVSCLPGSNGRSARGVRYDRTSAAGR